ncbi:hypothetical protein E1301_Tti001615 [Triplophysa tibetana]|uniref:Uncharacterized protein n=1 Tax=Triplophysa tibetana TaxID=1572043 RepID=A0A5A9P9F0_9TELE|nr:hypothetical protein E1301_Tti001615 [Triplophysa tibetana]
MFSTDTSKELSDEMIPPVRHDGVGLLRFRWTEDAGALDVHDPSVCQSIHDRGLHSLNPVVLQVDADATYRTLGLSPHSGPGNRHIQGPETCHRTAP